MHEGNHRPGPGWPLTRPAGEMPARPAWCRATGRASPRRDELPRRTRRPPGRPAAWRQRSRSAGHPPGARPAVARRGSPCAGDAERRRFGHRVDARSGGDRRTEELSHGDRDAGAVRPPAVDQPAETAEDEEPGSLAPGPLIHGYAVARDPLG